VGNVRCVEAGLCKASTGDFTHFVGSDLRGKPDAGAEERKIVGEDGGRSAEGEVEGGADQFVLGGHLFRQAIEDEIEVGFADDCDVERLDRRTGV